MHILLALTLIVGTTAAALLPAEAQDVKITIDRIVPNGEISGNVIGLNEAGRAGSKVVVYVYTDKWYIHPFNSGGEGRSFASIAKDGKWTIQTVKREHEASNIAALVVKRDAEVPAMTEDVKRISNGGIVVRSLKGTPDYGKL